MPIVLFVVVFAAILFVYVYRAARACLNAFDGIAQLNAKLESLLEETKEEQDI